MSGRTRETGIFMLNLLDVYGGSGVDTVRHEISLVLEVEGPSILAEELIDFACFFCADLLRSKGESMALKFGVS